MIFDTRHNLTSTSRHDTGNSYRHRVNHKAEGPRSSSDLLPVQMQLLERAAAKTMPCLLNSMVVAIGEIVSDLQEHSKKGSRAHTSPRSGKHS
jgi:hypothetical protein